MCTPAGSPLLDTAHHLIAKFRVFVSPGRLRGESEDRLPISRSLLQAHALRNHGLKHLRAEDAPDLLVNLARKCRPPVKKGYDDPQNAQIRVRSRLHFFDGLQKIVSPFKCRISGL